MRAAGELGVRPQTLKSWLDGKARPRRGSIMLLAAASGKPFEWWTDDRIVPSLFYRRAGPESAAAVAERPGGPSAAPPSPPGDLRRMVVRGDYAAPFAPHGAVVEFDASRPGRVRDGEYAVAEIDGELWVQRIDTHGDTRLYISINLAHPTRYAPLGEAGREYPITAVIVKPPSAGVE